MTWQLDTAGIAFLMATQRRLARGLPAAFPDDPDRPLTAAVLVNRELMLDLVDHPLVLTFFSLHHPVAAIGLAAATRLMPDAAVVPIGRQTAAWIAEAAPHDRVRDGVGHVVASGFSARSIDSLAWLARRTSDDDARDARKAILAILTAMTRPGPVPSDALPRLVGLSTRIGMKPATFEHLVLSLVEGRHVTGEAKSALIAGLDTLPRALRYRVMARVCALPADMCTAAMKQALAAHLAEPEERAAPVPGAAVARRRVSPVC